MAPTKNDKLEEDDTGTLIFFVNGKKVIYHIYPVYMSNFNGHLASSWF